MEKILLVLNAQQPDAASIDFACKVAAYAGSSLTGLFIENVYAAGAPLTTAEGSYIPASGEGETTMAVLTETERAIKIFLDKCREKAITTQVCVEKGEPIQKVLAESRFADMVVLDPELHFYNESTQLPSHFTKEILSRAECPVMLAPEMSQDIQEIVFCYDSSASSVYAIKQFTYLFPALSGMPVRVLEVNKTGRDDEDENHHNLKEWLQAHYTTVYSQTLQGEAREELFDYLFEKTGKVVVMGAYGRSLLSTFFRRSSADVLIRTIDMPIFITHH